MWLSAAAGLRLVGRTRGAKRMDTPHDLFRKVLAETGDYITAIRTIREQFGLDLRQAKEVMLQAEGIAESVAEHEQRIAEAWGLVKKE